MFPLLEKLVPLSARPACPWLASDPGFMNKWISLEAFLCNVNRSIEQHLVNSGRVSDSREKLVQISIPQSAAAFLSKSDCTGKVSAEKQWGFLTSCLHHVISFGLH